MITLQKTTGQGASVGTKICTVIALILPILSPYGIGTSSANFPLTDFVCICLICFVLIQRRKVISNKFLLFIWGICVFETIISCLFSSSIDLDVILGFKVAIEFMICLFAYSYLIKSINREFFFKVAETIGLICAALAILQYVFASVGYYDFYSGILPLPIEKYSHFGGLLDPNTGAIRVHSFFEEPSYLAIYMLPIFAHFLQQKRFLKATIIAVSCVCSSTMLGAVGIVLVLFITIIISSLDIKDKVKLCVLLIGIIVVLSVLYYKSVSLQMVVDYYVSRWMNMDQELMRSNSSASQRIIGNRDLYNEYPFLHKVIGTGINQYTLYFNIKSDYSNDLVCTLLNYGIIGIVTVIFWFLKLFRNTVADGAVFIVIFILVFSLDHIWFNMYFFYLLTWILIFQKEKDFIVFRL